MNEFILNVSIECVAVLTSYDAQGGDDDLAEDSAEPRETREYRISGGAAVLVSRAWRIITHGERYGHAPETVRTIRACSQGAGIGDPGNATSSRTVFDVDGTNTPRVLRGRLVESIDEDGVATSIAYDFGAFDPATREFAPGGDACLRIVESRSFNGVAFPERRVSVLETSYDRELYSATRLSDESVHPGDFGWSVNAYDHKSRLVTTRCHDGSWSTNAYSCCRLLFTVDREGRKIVRTARTGRDHLYHAMEEVSISELPHQSGLIPFAGHPSSGHMHKVVRRYFDAIGRETNAVTCCGADGWNFEDAAYAPNRGFISSERSVYPSGTPDHVRRIDKRGAVTETRGFEHPDRSVSVTEQYASEAALSPTVTTTTTALRNGGVTVEQSWGGKWTRQSRFTIAATDGCLVEHDVLESSDCGTRTNAVTRHDFLGRVAQSETPLSSVARVYDGATSRVLSTHDAKSGKSVGHIYDERGELVGQTSGGVTSLSEAGYEVISNELWRVESGAVFAGGVTNSSSAAKEQLTGLSDALRSRRAVYRDGKLASMSSSYVSPESDLVETAESRAGGVTVRKSRRGHLFETGNSGGAEMIYSDPYGREFARMHADPGSGAAIYKSAIGRDDLGDVVERWEFKGGLSSRHETRCGYDESGSLAARTNALGEVATYSYDERGNLAEVNGDAYPVRYACDTAGRKASMRTTCDGVNWDETRWTRDPLTGLVTGKIHADGSAISYEYTADGLLARTVKASGKRERNVYDGERRVARVERSGATPTDYFSYDVFGNVIAESNSVASVAHSRDNLGMDTNEVTTVGAESLSLERAYDDCRRLAVMRRGGGDPTAYAYAADGRLASISNADAFVEYAYAPDRRGLGYTLTLPDGGAFRRELARHRYIRPDIERVVNSFNGIAVSDLSYTNDALGRPVSRNSDAFAYNNRGELSSAVISSGLYTNAYDSIGNLTLSMATNVHRRWEANGLNQYTEIVSACGSRLPSYDIDGNITDDGRLAYAYDAASRLTFASGLGDDDPFVINEYDAKSRRVKKTTPEHTATYFYDGWNLIEERIAYTNGATETIEYFWGKDLSGSLQGAGGVGGLLYVKRNGAIYIPCCDANGNVTDYIDASGEVVASYTYDAFGGTISQSGALADAFAHRFSTKYLDTETGLYYYGYRFYSPDLMRWLNRDPSKNPAASTSTPSASTTH